MNISYVQFPYQGLLSSWLTPLNYNSEKDWEKRYNAMCEFEKEYKHRDDRCEEFTEFDTDIN